MKYQKTTAEYAKKYEVNERTIRRWRDAGYPLDDPVSLAKKIGKQKNLPQSYQRGAAPGTRNRHGLTPENLAFLAASQMMRQRVRKWTRSLTKAIDQSSSDDDLKLATSFACWFIDQEIKRGVTDMVKAKGGMPLQQIKRERAEEIAAFEKEGEDEE